MILENLSKLELPQTPAPPSSMDPSMSDLLLNKRLKYNLSYFVSKCGWHGGVQGRGDVGYGGEHGWVQGVARWVTFTYYFWRIIHWGIHYTFMMFVIQGVQSETRGWWQRAGLSSSQARQFSRVDTTERSLLSSLFTHPPLSDLFIMCSNSETLLIMW